MTANTQAIVGAFVLGGAVLLIGAIALFGKSDLFTSSEQAAVVFQGSVSGLTIGAPVTFRGVRVGAVDDIAVKFDPITHTASIPVILQLELKRVRFSTQKDGDRMSLPHLITLGLRAELNTQSFVTGQSEIDLDLDPASVAVLHPDITALPEIPIRQSAAQRVKEQLSQLPLREMVDNTNATLVSLRNLSEKLNLALPPLLQSVTSLTGKSSITITQADRSIAELQQRLDRSLNDLGTLTNNGSRALQQGSKELNTVLNSANQALLLTKEQVANFNQITSNSSADRINFDSMLRDLSAAAASVRGLANDVERNPRLLLTGRRP